MNPRLQRIQQLLRASGLLALIEKARFISAQVKSYQMNREFLQSHPNFAVPPAHLAFDAHGQVDWKNYHASGLETASRVAQEIQSLYPSGAKSVLEWGCGPGRVIRHLSALLPNTEIVGSDYNAESIQWCQQHIPQVSFVQNSLQPPLPLPAAKFDAVYAISVFTHLSETVCMQWINELARVLNKNGHVLIWTNGDKVSQYLLPEEKAQYDRAEFVTRSNYREGKKMYLSFHPDAWVQNRLLASFDVIQHYRGGFTGHAQDVWVAKLKG